MRNIVEKYLTFSKIDIESDCSGDHEVNLQKVTNQDHFMDFVNRDEKFALKY